MNSEEKKKNKMKGGNKCTYLYHQLVIHWPDSWSGNSSTVTMQYNRSEVHISYFVYTLHQQVDKNHKLKVPQWCILIDSTCHQKAVELALCLKLSVKMLLMQLMRCVGLSVLSSGRQKLSDLELDSRSCTKPGIGVSEVWVPHVMSQGDVFQNVVF